MEIQPYHHIPLILHNYNQQQVMFPNRLKLGNKRKDSVILKPTKLTFASHDKVDMENLENHGETQPVETTEVIKSTPNIQIYSPRLFPSQNNTITPFSQISNRPLSHREHPKVETARNDTNQNALKQLSQCKAKIDENMVKLQQYKSTIDVLTAENDSLKNNKKILEVELGNCSKDYYERQISRLKIECQNYQIECVMSQHKIDDILQAKDQLEAASKKKADQIKNYIKQLEREKLNVVQLRNQLNENEKTFKFALEESERSNEMLNKSHFQLSQKFAKLQSEFREKNKSVESLSMQNQVIASRSKESDNLTVAIRKRYQDILAQKQAKIATMINEHTSTVNQLGENIQKLKLQVKHLKDNQSTKSIQISKISLDIKSEQQNIDKSLKIVRLQQQIREMHLTIDSKDKTITSLESTLKEYFSPGQYCSLEKKYKQAEDKRLTSAKYYEEKLYNLQKENQKLKFQKLSPNSTSNSNTGVPTERDGCISFNDILRRNIEECTAIKEQLKLKIQQNQQIKSQMIEVKLREKKYINDMQILTKRLESQQKNIKIELEVERQKSTNGLDSLKRKLHTLQTRLQYKISQNKQKDDFIKNTIIGRSKASDVPIIMAELERIFLERQKLQLTKQ